MSVEQAQSIPTHLDLAVEADSEEEQTIVRAIDGDRLATTQTDRLQRLLRLRDNRRVLRCSPASLLKK